MGDGGECAFHSCLPAKPMELSLCFFCLNIEERIPQLKGIKNS